MTLATGGPKPMVHSPGPGGTTDLHPGKWVINILTYYTYYNT